MMRPNLGPVWTPPGSTPAPAQEHNSHVSSAESFAPDGTVKARLPITSAQAAIQFVVSVLVSKGEKITFIDNLAGKKGIVGASIRTASGKKYITNFMRNFFWGFHTFPGLQEFKGSYGVGFEKRWLDYATTHGCEILAVVNEEAPTVLVGSPKIWEDFVALYPGAKKQFGGIDQVAYNVPHNYLEILYSTPRPSVREKKAEEKLEKQKKLEQEKAAQEVQQSLF